MPDDLVTCEDEQATKIKLLHAPAWGQADDKEVGDVRNLDQVQARDGEVKTNLQQEGKKKEIPIEEEAEGARQGKRCMKTRPVALLAQPKRTQWARGPPQHYAGPEWMC